MNSAPPQVDENSNYTDQPSTKRTTSDNSGPKALSFNLNEAYQEVCEELTEWGHGDELCRIVVLGQQSMGKTTLLNVLMGDPLGFASGGCATRCPIEYHLRPSKPEENFGDGFGFWLDKERCTAGEVKRRMSEQMKALESVVDVPMQVRVAGHSLLHAVFVDLPGIQVDNDENAELTMRVARKYISEHPKDLFIVVTKADDDYNNRPSNVQKILRMLTPSHTIYVATHAVAWATKLAKSGCSTTEILDRLRHFQGENLAVPTQFAVELYILSDEEAKTPIPEQRQAMHRKLIESYQELARLLAQTANGKNKDAFAELLGRVNILEFGKTVEALFNKVLRRSLEEGFGQYKAMRKSMEQRRDEIQRQLETARDLRPVLIKFVGDFVDRCGRICRGAESNIHLIGEFGDTFHNNLKAGNKKAAQLFPGYLQETMNRTSCQALECHRKIGTEGKFARVQVDDGEVLGIITEVSPDWSVRIKSGTQKVSVARGQWRALLPIVGATVANQDVWEEYSEGGRIRVRKVRALNACDENGRKYTVVDSQSCGESSNLDSGESAVSGSRTTEAALFLDCRIPNAEDYWDGICGTGWRDLVVANQAFKLLAEYMYYLIVHFEPEASIPEDYIPNLQGSNAQNQGATSFSHVVEAIVMKNVQDSLIPLVKLISGAGAVAMKNVFDAAMKSVGPANVLTSL